MSISPITNVPGPAAEEQYHIIANTSITMFRGMHVARMSIELAPLLRNMDVIYFEMVSTLKQKRESHQFLHTLCFNDDQVSTWEHDPAFLSEITHSFNAVFWELRRSRIEIQL